MTPEEIKSALDAFVAEGDKNPTAVAEEPAEEAEVSEDLTELNAMFEQIKNKS